MKHSGSSSRQRRRVLAVVALLAAVAFIGIGWLRGGAIANRPAAAEPASGSAATAVRIPSSAPTPGSSKPNARSRLDSASSFRSTGIPLAKIYDELKARADAGDAAAASQLYDGVRQCNAAVDDARVVQIYLHQIDAADPNVHRMVAFADRADLRERMLQQLARDKALTANECAGLSAEQSHLVPAALRAAQLGDNAAANCYVSLPMAMAHGLIDHPEWLPEYKRQALTLAQAAVARGDWTMVVQLQQAYTLRPYGEGAALHQITGTDPAMAYRYGLLLRIGMARNTDISKALTEYGLANVAPELSSDAIRSAKAWAEATYRQHFADPPYSTELGEMSTCTDVHNASQEQ